MPALAWGLARFCPLKTARNLVQHFGSRAERRRRHLIAVLKGHQIVLQRRQRREVVRRQDLALYDREIDSLKLPFGTGNQFEAAGLSRSGARTCSLQTSITD
jgi:hypothetical protein